MFRILHYLSTAFLIGLAILSSRSPLPAPFPAAQGGFSEKQPAAIASIEFTTLTRENEEPEVSEDWYQPNEEDFKPAYQGDPINLAKQSWSDYWGWVKSFYAGNILDSGWTKRCKSVLSNIPNDKKRTELRIKLNTIGRTIAAEWAKTHEPRKIDTKMLINWGARLKAATNQDNGEGDAIQREIELIAKEIGI